MADILKRLSEIGIVPVIALEDAEQAVPLAKALIAGGLPAAEVTFRTEAGEEAIRRIYPENSVICRVSWLYGFGGPSFVHTMLQLADGSRPVLKVVSDQIGNPTSAVAVSRKLGELLERPEVTGTIHMTCEGEASWADFAREIFRRKGVKQEVLNCTTEEFPRPAPRPKNSRLVKQRLRELGFAPMPDWKDALSEFLKLEFK